MSIISDRLKNIPQSLTMAAASKVSKLAQDGIEILLLGIGEPDFDTPQNIKNSAIDAINSGFTKYTPAGGIHELKMAVCEKLLRDNRLNYNVDDVIICSGAKQVIFNLLWATINKGDEVLIPKPYWVSYPSMVQLVGGIPKFLHSDIETGFRINFDELSKSINKNTKWLLLNSPNNPSGVVYTESELLEIAKILRKCSHVHILSDDIYEYMTFGKNKFCNIANVAPDLRDRIFIVNGVSKSHAMTGWRIGYGVGSKDIIKAMTLLQSQSTSCPCSISQKAAITALRSSRDLVKIHLENIEFKIELVCNIFSKIDKLVIHKPNGAFYLFISYKKLLGSKTNTGIIIKSDNDFVEYLLTEAKVSVIPGDAFGLPGYFRLSCSISEDILKRACEQIISAINLLA